MYTVIIISDTGGIYKLARREAHIGREIAGITVKMLREKMLRVKMSR